VSGAVEPLRTAHRTALLLGAALCLGTPGLIAALMLSGAAPAGSQTPEGLFQQVGYLFTGLVFLSAAWAWGRRGRTLRAFRTVPEARRPAVIIREGLLFAAVFEVSSLCGLVYWLLVGAHAARHAWGFVVLTPVLFAALVPRYGQWVKGLED
jgi:hypothetical protein